MIQSSKSLMSSTNSEKNNKTLHLGVLKLASQVIMPTVLILALLIQLILQCYAHEGCAMATLEQMNPNNWQKFLSTSILADGSETSVNQSGRSQGSDAAPFSAADSQRESTGKWQSSLYTSDEDNGADADPFLLEFSSLDNYRTVEVLGKHQILHSG
jgi:hypothetical protein